ncbi:MAG: hypothetical protein WCO44_07020 [Bacteroidota bacterium]
MDLKKITAFVLNHKTPLNIRVFYYLSLVIIAIITVFPLFGAGIGSADDMGNYINTRFGKEVEIVKYMAEMSGRFYFKLTGLAHNLPYEVDNLFVLKLFQVVPILFCLFLFYKIVVIVTKSKEVSSLYVLLFFVIAQYTHHTSLFFNYPFYFSFSFSLILTSYLLLHRFQVTGKLYLLIGSALMFGLGLLFYEAYILFFCFSSLAIIYVNVTGGNRGWLLIRRSALQILPYLLVVIAYGLAYVIYGRIHPSEYSGTTMLGNNVKISTFFQVLWYLSNSAFPLTQYISHHNLFLDKSELTEGYRNVVPYLFFHARVEWIVKSILVLFVSYYMLLSIPKIPWKILLVGSVLAVLVTFFPHIPLALTQKYTFYAMTQGMLGYITALYSLFGVVLFISLVCAMILKLTESNTLVRHLFVLVISSGFVICSFLTDFSNYYIAQDVHQANIRMRVVDELIKSDEFRNIPSSSNIYSQQLWNNNHYMAGGITEQGFQWTYYILCKSKMLQNMIRDNREFLKAVKAPGSPGYMVVYRQAVKTDDAMLVLAQLESPWVNDSVVSHLSNRLILVYYSKCKHFSVSFRREDASPTEKAKIQISHIKGEVDPGNFVEFSIYNTKKNTAATIFTIESPSIDIRSIRISDMISPEGIIYYL